MEKAVNVDRICSSQSRRRSLVVFTLFFGLALASTTQSSELKEGFPRLGGIQIGSTPYGGYGDPEYQKAMAKLDLVLLGGSDRSINKHAKAIKDLNPDILLAKYTVMTQVVERENEYNAPLLAKLSSEKGPNNTNAFDWWLRDFDGEQVKGAKGGGYPRTNVTEWVKPDAKGRRWPEFKAEHDFDFYMHDEVWDIWYSDVSGHRPKFQNRGFIGDYSGGQVGESEVVRGWRRAHQTWWRAIRRLRPDVRIVVNHNWYLYQAKNSGVWDIKEYDKQVDGGLLEKIMSRENSFEANKGWDKLYEAYGWSMSYFRDPPILFFNVVGDPDDYQFFRYAFSTCLLGDAFFDYSPEKHYFGTVEWFDEFDRAGKDTTSWMGRPMPDSAFPREAWRKGVYRRDFEHAVVLVNPRGNGPQTVTVEPGLRRLEGRQAPAVNNGNAAEKITLADADGIVLVREDYSLEPRSPGIEVRK